MGMPIIADIKKPIIILYKVNKISGIIFPEKMEIKNVFKTINGEGKNKGFTIWNRLRIIQINRNIAGPIRIRFFKISSPW